MNSLEQEIIKRQTNVIGGLTTNIIELEIKLAQAIATIQAMEKLKELEGLKNGDTEQSNATGPTESSTEGLQQG